MKFHQKEELFPCSSVSKESACNAGDQGSIPGSGRSPGEGNGNPVQYSWLETLTRVGHDLATKPPKGSNQIQNVGDNQQDSISGFCSKLWLEGNGEEGLDLG